MDVTADVALQDTPYNIQNELKEKKHSTLFSPSILFVLIPRIKIHSFQKRTRSTVSAKGAKLGWDMWGLTGKQAHYGS